MTSSMDGFPHIVSVEKSAHGDVEKVINLDDCQLSRLAGLVAQKLRITPMSDSDLSNLAEKVTNYLCGKDHNGAKEPEPVSEYPMTAHDCLTMMMTYGEDFRRLEFMSERGGRWDACVRLSDWLDAQAQEICFRRTDLSHDEPKTDYPLTALQAFYSIDEDPGCVFHSDDGCTWNQHRAASEWIFAAQEGICFRLVQ